MTQPYTTTNPNAPIEDGPNASIIVGDVEFTDEYANYLENVGGDVESIFADYMIVSRYEGDMHRYMMGITSPDGFDGNNKAAFVQIASPTLLWIVDWTASKIGAQPEIPSQEPADPNWVILDVHFEPAMITVPADGETPIYRMSGTYVYGHKCPKPNMFQNVNYGRPPWLTDIYQRGTLPEKETSSLADTDLSGSGGDVAPGTPTVPA